jgi:hypothetical protein
MRTDIVGYGSELIGDDIDGFDDVDGDDMLGAFESIGDGFVGDDIGDDDVDGDDLMGIWYPGKKRKAIVARRKAMARAQAAALANRRVREGAILKDVQPTKSREYILGFDVTSVPGGASVNITKRPQVIFRPERIVIPSAVGVDFQVLDVKVGKNSQFTASGSVPAIVFAETSFGVRLKMDTCQVSMDVTLSVQNTNAAARNFTAAVIGPAVE